MTAQQSRTSSKMYTSLKNDTCADIRLLGSPNVFYSFPQFTSASRTGMFAHNLPQLMVNHGDEFNRIFTGTELQRKDYAFDDSRRDQDVEVLAILPKYRFNDIIKGDNKTCPVILVICRGLEDNEIHYFEIKRYHLGMNGFGFMTKMHNWNRIYQGAILDKDMPIATSPSIQGDRVAFGKNLNVVYGSFAETIEDAFAISESAAKALNTDLIYQVPIISRPDRRPVNIHGTENDERPFPDINTFLKDDGIIHAARPVSWMTCTADTDPESMRQCFHLQDDIYYGVAGAEIIDLDFVANHQTLTTCYRQVNQYIKANESYWVGIYKTYLKYKKTYKLSKEMWALVRQAIYRLASIGYQDMKFLTESERRALRSADIESPSGGILEFLHTTVTYRAERKFSPGDKISGLCGNGQIN